MQLENVYFSRPSRACILVVVETYHISHFTYGLDTGQWVAALRLIIAVLEQVSAEVSFFLSFIFVFVNCSMVGAKQESFFIMEQSKSLKL